MSLLREIRLSARTLLKHPAFTAMAVVTLALAISANTAVFSLVNAFLLRPLPYSQPEKLVHLWETDQQSGARKQRTSLPGFRDWTELSRSFEGLAAFYYGPYTLTGGEHADRIEVARVSANLPSLLGVAPALGRVFAAGEDRPGQNRVILLSDRLWRRQFGGDPGVVGRRVQLDREPYEVVGVMPPGFEFPMRSIEAWIPLGLAAADHPRNDRMLQVVGRLRDGVTLAQAQAEMNGIAQGLAASYPAEMKGRGVNVVPLREALVFFYDKVRLLLLALAATSGLVLLIAATNVASGMTAWAIERSREMAIRLAIGASRRRLVGQLLTESALLALAGAGAGVLLAVWAARLLSATVPQDLYRVGEIEVDGRAVGFSLLAALVAMAIFGLSPVIQSFRVDFVEGLKDGKTLGGGVRRRNARKLLVVSQMVMALALLTSAALTIQSFARLLRVDPGFDHESVLTVELSVPESQYPDGARVASFYRQTLERLRALPGVQAAAATDLLPLNFETNTREYELEGQPVAGDARPRAIETVVTPGYFETLRVPLLRGRGLSDRDDETAQPVVVVSQALAAKIGGGDLLGRRLRLLDQPPVVATIIGVVGDVKHRSLHEPVEPQIYRSQYQVPQRANKLLVRAGSAAAAAPAVRQEIWRLDPGLPLKVRSLDEILRESLALPRLLSLLLTIFAIVALSLAAVGIYGLIWNLVSERTQEIGVRIAMGAGERDILRLIVSQGARLALAGLVLGVPAGFALARLLGGFLYGVDATDPLTFAATAAFILGVALLASYMPARSALRIDPVIALKTG